MPTTTRPPSSSIDLFTDAALRDPYPLYARLRRLGPAVYLHRYNVWALTGYQDVHAALTDEETFSSAKGIALTAQANQHILTGTVLASDGTEHARLRRPLSRQLNPRAMRTLTDRIHEHADHLATQHTRPGRFDAVALARDLVADIVIDLMGLPNSTRDRLINGAADTFNCFGPDNPRYRASAPAAAAMIAFLHTEVTRDSVRPGSWMAALYEAADNGEIDETDVVPLMSAYTAAGMDTTIAAISTAIYLLATHPKHWKNLRTGRISADDIFHETLRLETPIQAFGRRVARDTRIGNIKIKTGEQVWLLYGAAGRDPRAWGTTAHRFNPQRPNPDHHLALGAGRHLCAGNHLAALETRAVLTALARQCTHLEPEGKPTRALNNTLRGFACAPIKATPTRDD